MFRLTSLLNKVLGEVRGVVTLVHDLRLEIILLDLAVACVGLTVLHPCCCVSNIIIIKSFELQY